MAVVVVSVFVRVGALDYTQMPRIAFSHLSEYFKGSTALIIPHKMDLGLIDIPLREGVLPLMH